MSHTAKTPIDQPTSMLELSVETESPVKLMSLSPEGNYLATVDERNYCHIYKLEYETQLVAKQIQARYDILRRLLSSFFEVQMA